MSEKELPMEDRLRQQAGWVLHQPSSNLMMYAAYEIEELRKKLADANQEIMKLNDCMGGIH